MNHRITPTSVLSTLIPSLAAIAAGRGVIAEKFELEDTVLRAGGFAWDIGAEAAPLHVQIDALLAAKKAADEAAEAARIADELANPRPWRVSKDTMVARIVAAGALPKVMAVMSQQPADKQFVFLHSAWFHSDNAELRGLCSALGMDPDVILARDEFLM